MRTHCQSVCTWHELAARQRRAGSAARVYSEILEGYWLASGGFMHSGGRANGRRNRVVRSAKQKVTRARGPLAVEHAAPLLHPHGAVVGEVGGRSAAGQPGGHGVFSRSRSMPPSPRPPPCRIDARLHHRCHRRRLLRFHHSHTTTEHESP